MWHCSLLCFLFYFSFFLPIMTPFFNTPGLQALKLFRSDGYISTFLITFALCPKYKLVSLICIFVLIYLLIQGWAFESNRTKIMSSLHFLSCSHFALPVINLQVFAFQGLWKVDFLLELIRNVPSDTV